MTVNTDELNSTAVALRFLYSGVAVMDGELEDVERAKMDELLAEWGLTIDDPAAFNAELAGYAAFSTLGDSIAHACNVLKDNIEAKYHIAVVRDLARMGMADGHVDAREAAFWDIVRERMGVTLEDLK